MLEEDYKVMEAVGNIIHRALSTCSDDECWKSFGYTKRPKYGAIINKFFRNKKKVEEEHFIWREVFFCVVGQSLTVYCYPQPYIQCFCDVFMEKCIRIFEIEALNHEEQERYFRSAFMEYYNSESVATTVLDRYEKMFHEPAPKKIQQGASLTAVAMEFLREKLAKEHFSE